MKYEDVTQLHKTLSERRAKEIWDSGQSASSPLLRPCLPKQLIIYHSALIGLSRVLQKQLPWSAPGSNTDTDVHPGEHERVHARRRHLPFISKG